MSQKVKKWILLPLLHSTLLWFERPTEQSLSLIIIWIICVWFNWFNSIIFSSKLSWVMWWYSIYHIMIYIYIYTLILYRYQYLVHFCFMIKWPHDSSITLESIVPPGRHPEVPASVCTTNSGCPGWVQWTSHPCTVADRCVDTSENHVLETI